MRLTVAERQAIEDAARATLPPATKVWLFGSRVDDQRAGGDIDLLLEPAARWTAVEQVQRRQAFVARLWRLLGERRIDVLIDEAPDAADAADAAGPQAAVLASARSRRVALTST